MAPCSRAWCFGELLLWALQACWMLRCWRACACAGLALRGPLQQSLVSCALTLTACMIQAARCPAAAMRAPFECSEFHELVCFNTMQAAWQAFMLLQGQPAACVLPLHGRQCCVGRLRGRAADRLQVRYCCGIPLGSPVWCNFGCYSHKGSTVLPLSDAACSAGLVSEVRPKLCLTATETVFWAGWQSVAALLLASCPAGLVPAQEPQILPGRCLECCLATYVLGLQVLCLAEWAIHAPVRGANSLAKASC